MPVAEQSPFFPLVYVQLWVSTRRGEIHSVSHNIIIIKNGGERVSAVNLSSKQAIEIKAVADRGGLQFGSPALLKGFVAKGKGVSVVLSCIS